ncbi:hypothetical protein, partial [Jatrophihabitans sp.]|uniref:hypothetical protein n=1 Tax=Jatrophihabitans sp. TaxID=1932789 RepID=UPI002EE444CB
SVVRRAASGRLRLNRITGSTAICVVIPIKRGPKRNCCTFGQALKRHRPACCSATHGKLLIIRAHHRLSGRE